MKFRHIWLTSAILATLILLESAGTANATETVVYSQGFESNNGGFVTSYGAAGWAWGTPPSLGWGPGGAHSGLMCWGTFLNNQKILRYVDGSIVSPAIPLPSISANQIIRVRFYAFVSLDGMYDRGQFFVSKDGVNWESKIQLYNNMETSPYLAPSWKKYEISLDSSYSGANVYLRFRAATPNPVNFFCGGSDDLSGLFIDDLAITVYDTTGDKKILTMNAYEDASTWASCPWVAPWNGSAFVPDNDIYSVARGPENEYLDFYKLMQPLVGENGAYSLQIKELESETSHTDYAALMEIDHAADVAVAPDEKGALHAYRPASLLPPQAATDPAGRDVLSMVEALDDLAYPAYSGNTVTLDFGNADLSRGALLVLRVQGFVMGSGTPAPYAGPPAVIVETMDGAGQWQERGRLLPRYKFSVAAFDLSPYLPGPAPFLVRLRSISHDVKYHAIDLAALYTGSAPPFNASLVLPSRAVSGAADILNKLETLDGGYFSMSPGENCTLQFAMLPLAAGLTRDFVFVSEGYYLPEGGSYLIYTWDGTDWVERDATTYPGSYGTRSFDLSLFLPDPDGEYKVRVWQDYQYEPAGINSVNLTVGGSPAPLNWGWDYRYGTSIYLQALNIDSLADTWSGCPRNRVTEFKFTPPAAMNTPPTTFPVAADSVTRTISWAYSDAEGDPQALAEVQIWDGPGATGINWWNPAVFSGTGTSVVYPSSLLPPGNYYARVKANDGKDWGQWSEGEFAVVAPAPAATARRLFNSLNMGPPYYYQITATDPIDPVTALKLYVADSASGLVAGPYPSGSILRLQKGTVPGVLSGGGLLKAIITVAGDAHVYAENSSGVQSPVVVIPLP